MNLKVITMIAGIALMAGAAVAKETTAEFSVPKMDCGSCAVVVKRAFVKTVGVKSTSIDVDRRTVSVTYEDTKVTVPQLRQVIEKSGFEIKAPVTGK
ncbi:MAG: cation transporter [Gemmatimonadaceae bacterium]